MSWEWIISIGILVTLGLAIWARVSGLTIPELLREIRDFLTETIGGEEPLQVID